MDERYEIKNQRLEESLWWTIARREIIYDLIRNLDKNLKILDVGCSGGPMMIMLNQHGFQNVYGLVLTVIWQILGC